MTSVVDSNERPSREDECHDTVSISSRRGLANDIRHPEMSKVRMYLLVTQIVLCVTTCGVTTGFMIISIPTISRDLGIAPSLSFWPVLVATLTSSCLLLPFGGITTVIGTRLMDLAAIVVLAVTSLGISLSRSLSQIIASRALGGVGLAMLLPASVTIISQNIVAGWTRNVCLSLLGLSQVTGYGVGLVTGGVLADTIGWRAGYDISCGIFAALLILGIFVVPRDLSVPSGFSEMRCKLMTELDWIGIVLSTASLACLVTVLGQVSASPSNIRQPPQIILLVLCFVLLLVFIWWCQRQEKSEKPALLPTRLWKSCMFSSLCVMVALSYAELQTMELLSSNFFQNVQKLSAIQSSVRILPNLIVGAILNLVTGALVHRFPAAWLVASGATLGAGAPLLMALMDPSWTYWSAAFVAQMLSPLCVDVMFTVGLLLSSEQFSPKDQPLAAAVFNLFSQLGQSLGLAIIAVITGAVSRHSGKPGRDPQSLLEGYRAGFWTAFAWMLSVGCISVFSLWRVGKVGARGD